MPFLNYPLNRIRSAFGLVAILRIAARHQLLPGSRRQLLDKPRGDSAPFPQHKYDPICNTGRTVPVDPIINGLRYSVGIMSLQRPTIPEKTGVDWDRLTRFSHCSA